MNCPKCGYPHAHPPKCRACGEPITEEMVKTAGLGLPVARAEETAEGKLEARVKELTEGNTRRELEALARDAGITPSKREYPDKEALAKAIAEKEFPPEEEAEVTVEETPEED